MINVFKSISKDIVKTMQEVEVPMKETNIIPLNKINKLKKHKFKVQVKKLKKENEIQYYQILIFFKMFNRSTFSEEYMLVYATNKKAKIIVENKEINGFFWRKYTIQRLRFEDVNEESKLYKWCGKFRNAFDIMEQLRKERHNIENF